MLHKKKKKKLVQGHDRAKHSRPRSSDYQGKMEAGILNFIHTHTHIQVVGILTEALPRVKFEDAKSQIRKIDIYSPMQGIVLNSNLNPKV